MLALIDVVLPVFFIVAFGYLAAWRGWFTESAVDGLMKFAQGFAIPCLLFRAISTLDLSAGFQLPLLGSFYLGAIAGFLAGLIGARLFFGRPWEDSVAIGFCTFFSNSVLLGLPISERAYGTEALAGNFAIISIHAPFCYGLAITVMEVVRARGAPMRHLPGKVLKAMFSNSIILGIALGFAVNLTGTTVPQTLAEGLDMMGRAALPAALFGLGGVLCRYRPEGDIRTILYISLISLVLHPVITYTLGSRLDLGIDGMRSAVLTASMAPGVNAYLFASMYGVAQRVAASAVLLSTALSVISVSVWLAVLP